MPPKRPATQLKHDPQSSTHASDAEDEPDAASTAPSPKKVKTENEPCDANDDDQPYTLQLDGKRKLTVSQFKGITLVNIREYYTDKKDGLDKPTKKGIALSPAAWATMKANFADIDEAITAQEAKS
ncbi:activated RNA polymerase II transcriptional coactivator p15-like protein [Powellomyces hirtus]|nr:activated RNA polymerase II transcriptional coactivator p15-like protein [Powellomyces hirtus]